MRVYPARAVIKENAREQFLAQFADSILCTLGCFDRLLFKGYLPISHPASVERWLASGGIEVVDASSRCRVDGNTTLQNGGYGIRTFGTNHVVIRNDAGGNAIDNYAILAGNDPGPIGAAATATSPWANIQH